MITFALITLNEEKNLERCIKSFIDISNSIVLLDSYSSDKTIEIARRYNAQILQNKFKNFGDQWNYLINNSEINTKWVFKIDPDEELTKKFKNNLIKFIETDKSANGFYISRQLFFLGKKIPIKQKVLRIWKNGFCRFSNLEMNEFPIIKGNVSYYKESILHHDSPSIEHWLNKHNKYSTLEANNIFKFYKKKQRSIDDKKIFYKNIFFKIPFRYFFLFFYYLFINRMISTGKVGVIWSKLRVEYYRSVEYKIYEYKRSKKIINE